MAAAMRQWFAEERNDGCYVIETQPGKTGCIVFGPMVEELVLAFISACRTMVETEMKRAGMSLSIHTC